MTKTRKQLEIRLSPGKLGWKILVSPRAASQDCLKGASLAASLWIYAAFLAAFAVFTLLKPPGFPSGQAATPESLGIGSVVQATLWNLPVEAAWIVFLMGLVRFFQTGALPVRLALGTAWAATPLILVALYLHVHAMGRGAFLAGAAVWLGLFYPLLRRTGASDWLKLTSFMLALNAIAIAFLPFLTATALARHENAFIAVQVVMGLWLLGAGASGLRELWGLRLARAFMAILLSVAFQAAFCLTLYSAGLVPLEILKVMLFG
ncbi:MAG: hypothetical protein HY748_09940 [Elusimicrobia bacterium]|nr:hypothetical protein [Elusimicrobiota bacterium]